MASIHQEIAIEAPAERVWDAVRDLTCTRAPKRMSPSSSTQRSM
jgi:hypothetical protein